MSETDGLQADVVELCDGQPETAARLQIEHARDFAVYSVPPGEKIAQPVVVIEIWNGRLRVLVYPDGKDEPVIIPIGNR